MLNVLIIDDEAPAREELRALLQAEPDIEIVDEAANAIEGLAAINRLHPDVVFLDIQMPRISGLEMLSMLDKASMPRVVFVTAYDEYALNAFEEHATDYLLKPVDPVRLAKTLEWLRSGKTQTPHPAFVPPAQIRQIPCYARNRIILMRIEEVEFIHSELSGVQVVCAAQTGQTELTLKTLEEKTPLLRCHRQYLVNPEHIGEIVLQENGGAEIVTRSGRKVPVSRRYLRELKEYLHIP
ncbi:two component transcriptional regulator, LytTR family [Formivibrio citricus]|uniref:Two component transcriptional regulator, LytTR family n=1 Tax=Formivibrio citricus TaxID=83765 RepID=A0A1I4V9T2_9NEIS|nr:two-component system response regulator BtsR [Formivibrio citricus]SFM97942.1 two component transcriptional regulator, LytTR family [Formivibrio citricus]